MKYDRTVIAYHGCDSGKTADKLLRKRDSAVLNFYFDELQREGMKPYDTVRCGFVEGASAFKGSGIRHQSHVHIAVSFCFRRRRRTVLQF